MREIQQPGFSVRFNSRVVRGSYSRALDEESEGEPGAHSHDKADDEKKYERPEWHCRSQPDKEHEKSQCSLDLRQCSCSRRCMLRVRGVDIMNRFDKS